MTYLRKPKALHGALVGVDANFGNAEILEYWNIHYCNS